MSGWAYEDDPSERLTGRQVIEQAKREASERDALRDHERLYGILQPHLEVEARKQQRLQASGQAGQNQQLQQLQQLATYDPARAVAAAYQWGGEAKLNEVGQGIGAQIDAVFEPEVAQRVLRSEDAFEQARRAGRAEVEQDKRQQAAPTTTTKKPMRSYFGAAGAELGYQPQG